MYSLPSPSRWSDPLLPTHNFFIISHGERRDSIDERWITHCRATNQTQELIDPPITARGKLQARAAASVIQRRGGAVRVLSSPFRRCLETAWVVADQLGVGQVQVEEGLGEWLNPMWYPSDPMPKLCYPAHGPRNEDTPLSPTYVPGPVDDSFESAQHAIYPENIATALDRYCATIEGLLARAREGTLAESIVLVTHVHGMMAMAEYFADARVMECLPCSVTHVSGTPKPRISLPNRIGACAIGRWQLELVADGTHVEHLVDGDEAMCAKESTANPSQYPVKLVPNILIKSPPIQPAFPTKLRVCDGPQAKKFSSAPICIDEIAVKLPPALQRLGHPRGISAESCLSSISQIRTQSNPPLSPLSFERSFGRDDGLPLVDLVACGA